MPTEVKVPLTSFYRFVIITAILPNSYQLMPRRSLINQAQYIGSLFYLRTIELPFPEGLFIALT